MCETKQLHPTAKGLREKAQSPFLAVGIHKNTQWVSHFLSQCGWLLCHLNPPWIFYENLEYSQTFTWRHFMFYQKKGLKQVRNKLSTFCIKKISSEFCIFHRKSQYDLHACDFLGWKIHYLHQVPNTKIFPNSSPTTVSSRTFHWWNLLYHIHKKHLCEAAGITPPVQP